MSKIQIADLQTGTELFQGNESFLTELQPVEANVIYGGKKGTGGGKKTGKSIGKSSRGKYSSKSSGGKSSGGLMCPPPPGGGGGGIVVLPGGG